MSPGLSEPFNIANCMHIAIYTFMHELAMIAI